MLGFSTGEPVVTFLRMPEYVFGNFLGHFILLHRVLDENIPFRSHGNGILNVRFPVGFIHCANTFAGFPRWQSLVHFFLGRINRICRDCCISSMAFWAALLSIVFFGLDFCPPSSVRKHLYLLGAPSSLPLISSSTFPFAIVSALVPCVFGNDARRAHARL